jgi:hypothetical protein
MRSIISPSTSRCRATGTISVGGTLSPFDAMLSYIPPMYFAPVSMAQR